MIFFKRENKKIKKENLTKKRQTQDKNNLKKEIFYNEIKTLRENITPINYNFDISKFENSFISILASYNCSFGYQNKNSKKHGHVKRKVNLQTKVETLELKIERNDNMAGKIYTIIHELTHLVNEHLIRKNLTYKQKEVVADTVSLMFINHLNLEDELKKSMLSKKWDINSYAKGYIYNMSFSKEREKIMISQIENTYKYLCAKLL